MERAQVRIPLADAYKALKEPDGNKSLKTFVFRGLLDMAERHRVEVPSVLPLLDEIVKEILEESVKFNPSIPYPSPVANSMNIDVELPTKGKVGVIGFDQIVQV